MKQMRYLLAVCLLALSVVASGQKIKLKKGDVLIDDTPWLKYDGCGTFDSACSLINAGGDEIIFVKMVGIEGEKPITPSNPHGTLTYYEVKFLGLNAVAEFEDISQKRVIENLYKGKVVAADGTLDEEMVQRFVEKYGNPVSARLNRNTNTTNTVIIHDEAPRSGVNIHLGR
jgi:hypothetical protein